MKTDLRRAGVLNLEMEAATVFTLARLYGFRAEAVFAVVAHRLKDTFRYEGIDQSVRVANEAVSILASWDALRRAANKLYWFPGLLRSGEG